MKINYSGWSEKYGSFRCDIFIDEKRTDYEVHFESGQVLRQCGGFQHVTADWNCDGDVYTQFGVWFERCDADGKVRSGREFLTPDDLVAELIDGLYGDDWPTRDRVVSISGVSVPSLNKRQSLASQIANSENRQMAQDIEKARLMKAFGVREPENSGQDR